VLIHLMDCCIQDATMIWSTTDSRLLNPDFHLIKHGNQRSMFQRNFDKFRVILSDSKVGHAAQKHLKMVRQHNIFWGRVLQCDEFQI
jgi:hypothetical protein